MVRGLEYSSDNRVLAPLGQDLGSIHRATENRNGEAHLKYQHFGGKDRMVNNQRSLWGYIGSWRYLDSVPKSIKKI